jgi:hypothetical protein
VPPEVGQEILERSGCWLYDYRVRNREYFLPYDEFPWFKEARIGQVVDVKLVHSSHLYWAELDVDLDVDSLENLESYPLVYQP